MNNRNIRDPTNKTQNVGYVHITGGRTRCSASTITLIGEKVVMARNDPKLDDWQKRLFANKKELKPGEYRCSHCGEILTPSDYSCGNCGRTLMFFGGSAASAAAAASDAAAAAAAAARRAAGSAALALLLALLAVAVAAVALWLWLLFCRGSVAAAAAMALAVALLVCCGGWILRLFKKGPKKDE